MDETRWCLLNIGTLSQNKLWGETERRRIPYCTMTLIRAGETTILIDPTRPPEEMARYLDDASGLTPDQVDIVFLTHFHHDHFRGIEAFPHAIWLMEENETAIWWEQAREGSREQEILNRIEAAPPQIAPGVELFRTPGHTPHHTSLLLHAQGKRVMVAGDAVMTCSHYLARHPYADRTHHDQALRSMERAVQAADIVIPGHDNYFHTRDLLQEWEGEKG
jgi:glyoxylase-like metal-dependent hydrolase (beta-lactamase superfamily II)